MKHHMVESKLLMIWWQCRTWGEVEKAAGVTDRDAFWARFPHEYSEDEAREELRRMIRQRITRGEI